MNVSRMNVIYLRSNEFDERIDVFRADLNFEELLASCGGGTTKERVG